MKMTGRVKTDFICDNQPDPFDQRSLNILKCRTAIKDIAR